MRGSFKKNTDILKQAIERALIMADAKVVKRKGQNGMYIDNIVKNRV